MCMSRVQAMLTEDEVQRLAKDWYENYGPYRGTYEYRPMAAFRTSETEWSVSFRVQPDTGYLYFRQFTFTKSSEGEWEVVGWAEDPEHPDVDAFNPDDYDEEDDLETLEQEEYLARLHHESHAEELHGLEEVRLVRTRKRIRTARERTQMTPI